MHHAHDLSFSVSFFFQELLNVHFSHKTHKYLTCIYLIITEKRERQRECSINKAMERAGEGEEESMKLTRPVNKIGEHNMFYKLVCNGQLLHYSVVNILSICN